MANIPMGGTELNIGVEDGPDAVMTPDFLQNFKGVRVTSFSYSLPEVVPEQDYQRVVAGESQQFAELVNQTLSAGETQVAIGGDHSISFGTLLAVLSRTDPTQVGHIQFDSQGDLHEFGTSPTGNFHGMWLRPFIGNFDSPDIEQVARFKLRPDQVLFIGNLELEPEEIDFFAENRIARIGSSDLATNRLETLDRVRAFAKRFKHLHISFDVDVFHRDYVSATGTPAQEGFEPADIFEILELLKPVESKSIDLVEVNPRKDKAEDTIEMAQKVLLRICR